jgi:hypothetical protein
MDNNPTLKIDTLTASRQTLLTDALAGHRVDLTDGKFTDMSRDSLAKVGLSPIEIAAIEQDNADGGAASLQIAASDLSGSDNNPFTKAKWNLESQRNLHENNPSLARKLMKEAGLLK